MVQERIRLMQLEDTEYIPIKPGIYLLENETSLLQIFSYGNELIELCCSKE